MPRVIPVTRAGKPLSPTKLLEKQITQQVCDYLRHRGWRPVRMQRTVLPGAFQSGEPGQPDYLMLRYITRARPPQACLAFWCEFKAPAGRTREHQREWHQRERARGGVVWVVDDFDWFLDEYERAFGWLHSGERATGQLDLLAGLAPEREAW